MGIPVDDLERALGTSLVHRAVEEHSRPPHNGIQRRAQFMGKGRQKVIFGPVGRFGFATSGRFPLQERCSFPLGLRPGRHIPHKAGESRWILARHACDRDFDGELAPVGMAGSRFDAPIDEGSLPGG